MAPLGVVKAMELAFGLMFIALLIWSLANYLYVSFGHLHMHKEGEKLYVERSFIFPPLLFFLNFHHTLVLNLILHEHGS